MRRKTFVYLDKLVRAFPRGKQRVVILSQVLPANSTIGYDNHLVVTKVNGREIKSLADLAEAVKTPVNGFHMIETVDDPKQIELDASQAAAEAGALQKNYGLPAMERLP